jgi:hypothetical protein
MSATIISFAALNRRPSAASPDDPKEEAAQIRRRLAAIENHRGRIATYKHSKDDPIFEAIDAHCAALVAYHTAPDDKASEAAMAHESEVLRELVSCRPNFTRSKLQSPSRMKGSRTWFKVHR